MVHLRSWMPVGHSAGTNRYPRAIYSNRGSVTLLELTLAVVRWILVSRLVCRGGGDSLGGRRDRRLDRGLNVPSRCWWPCWDQRSQC